VIRENTTEDTAISNIDTTEENQADDIVDDGVVDHGDGTAATGFE